ATFGLAKPGHLVYPGKEHTGKLRVVDIGIPKMIMDQVGATHFALTEDWVKDSLVPRKPEAHKGDAGRLLVVGGSPGKSGAAVMAALAAMRVGAGLVTLAGPRSLVPGFQGQAPEIMALALDETLGGGIAASAADQILEFAASCDGLALGPGLGMDEETIRMVHRVVRECPVPMVLDADGLNALAGDLEAVQAAKSTAILTPHPGEMARLCGLSPAAVQADRLGRARGLAADLGCVCVLKGAATVVALPRGEVWINTTGNPGMASGGMGDVLTGIAAGFLVQGYAPETAARLAVFLHGLAGDRLADTLGLVGYLAGDLILELPETLGSFLSKLPIPRQA
ncbi:MAG: NAD(P)H-hydrate dehydratase, partial [Pseudomonadota bacterium]